MESNGLGFNFGFLVKTEIVPSIALAIKQYLPSLVILTSKDLP
jgi:hypothetical protein